MRLLWIPHTSWQTPQRAHLFCRALSKKHEVHVTDWVADFKLLNDYFSKRYIKNFFYRNYYDEDIKVHGIPRISPALYFSFVRHLNSKVYSYYVSKIIKEYSIEVVVSTFVVPPPVAPRLIFDLFDENVAKWLENPKTIKYACEINKIEEMYIQKADTIVAASYVLADKVRMLSENVKLEVIPNAVDLQLFKNVDIKAVREQLGFSNEILIGSVGNHDDFNELIKILNVAKRFKGDKTVFLIAGRGSAIPKAIEYAKKEEIKNIKFIGYLSMENATKIIAALDVGLCPYRKSKMDDARSPMRLLMYLAAGIPVVCTDIEEIKRLDLEGVILAEDNIVSFYKGIRLALTIPKAKSKQVENYDIKMLSARYEKVLLGV